MNDTYITIVGNVVDEPRLRTTSSSGVPVLSFRVASTSRRLDRETGKWQDSDRLFATVTCWRALAQNVARSLKKGQPVIVTGRFYSREYTTKDETSRVSYEVDAAAIGHDLSRGISEFTRWCGRSRQPRSTSARTACPRTSLLSGSTQPPSRRRCSQPWADRASTLGLGLAHCHQTEP
jgi:single-strand DNA-binding protein